VATNATDLPFLSPSMAVIRRRPLSSSTGFLLTESSVRSAERPPIDAEKTSLPSGSQVICSGSYC